MRPKPKVCLISRLKLGNASGATKTHKTRPALGQPRGEGGTAASTSRHSRAAWRPSLGFFADYRGGDGHAEDEHAHAHEGEARRVVLANR